MRPGHLGFGRPNGLRLAPVMRLATLGLESLCVEGLGGLTELEKLVSDLIKRKAVWYIRE